MATATRQLTANKYWVNVQGHRYLQVEQVNNELFYSKTDESDSD